jgi:putative DNA primase/helicase
MTAETIAKALGGRRTGGSWMARCPAHDDRTPSLSIRDTDGGTVLIHCHAGCDQQQVISVLRSLGVWDVGDDRGAEFCRPKTRVSQLRPLGGQDAERTAIALNIWRSAISAKGTPVETYLASRGLPMSPPAALRFHPALKHPSGDNWPAMVALIMEGGNDTPIAIHRTFLARDGVGKAPIDPAKMVLGPSRGGAVKLGTPSEVLLVGEGIETCLSAMLATGHPAWAALSTSGLLTLELPGDVQDVLVLADADAPGEAAARACGHRWKREGRRVRIARPPAGLDFNDLLTGRIPGKEEEAL